ncbi:hypothetical protein AA0111_g11876 [Alternaria arborescens]|uniref:hypothetical protein n=1 Tax=Alternaria arborescens TaxID=156630 RepID=UPI001074BEEA|nr:hypothetical protein AA0111_g11876 [Alternaria arborescens]RYO14811.1 hypothetical protein AA0111_g11876 [Alternaria arborescens]
MAQNAVAASQPNLPDQRSCEGKLVLCPDSDGTFQCHHCSKRYGFRCHEPYKRHLRTEHKDPIDHICIEPKRWQDPVPDIKTLHKVWCKDGTHCVRVTVSQFLGPNSAVKRVDEDETFTTESFLRKEFQRTKVYEDTVKKITELDGRCCKPVPNAVAVNARKYPFINTASKFAQSSFGNVSKWLGLCFFSCLPTQRRRSHRNSSARYRGPNLRRSSHHPSKEAIVPDTSHRSNTDTNTYEEPTDSKGGMEYRISTANLFVPKYASADMLAPTQTIPKHANRIANASLSDQITGVVAVGSFYSTCEGVYGCQVIVLTRSDSVRLLQRVDFGALVEYERIARQLRAIIGDSVFDQLSQLEQKRMDIRDPVYRGLVPEEGLQIKEGEALPLELCPPILQAYVKSVVLV